MVILAVAGGGTVSPENIGDLLADFLLFDTPDEREFAFYLPADRELTTTAVLDTASWLGDNRAGFTAVTVGSPGRKGKTILEDAEDEIGDDIGDDDDGAAEVLIKVLAEARERGEEAYLILAWGPEDGADDSTRHLLELAQDAGIDVKDLTAGLDDLGYVDEYEPEAAEPEEEPEPEQPKRRSRAKQDEPVEELTEQETELDADEAQTEVEGQPAKSDEMPDLITTLGFVVQRLDFEDRANAAAQMMQYYNRPLTKAVRYHLQLLLEQAAENGSEKAAEEVSEPPADTPAKRRGKPRDVDSDVIKVYVHEGNKTARQVPGRGRPKKGEVTKEMTRAEFNEMLAGDYTEF
ncbi:hypothetical protein [Nonomuraea roseoviolacea]|uniref:hypothetical protein n=1 Tax=Nonomuraea roseoviolacea TaxID=103837 RepID=UPI0031DA2E3C